MNDCKHPSCGSTHDHSSCTCFIIPPSVFDRLANDRELSADQRRAFADMGEFEKEWRKVRTARVRQLRAARALLPSAVDVARVGPPSASLYDCHHGTVLPGAQVPNPGTSSDLTAKRAYLQSLAVAKFYKAAFGRDSIDGHNMSLVSSIHYSVKYNNAFWNGSQMTYGDGDGNIFVDFTKAGDVIGHELTHGVTQYTLSLNYANQPGGLNESLSDVFGSMFRQWQAKQAVTKADWLIGKEIMGPGAKARGFTCLRDLANPAAAHCLSPQPTKFSQYHDGMDPHESSGIPNFAFYKAAMAIGGKSWEKAGKIWYRALTGSGSKPGLKMGAFANLTRAAAVALFPKDAAVIGAVDKAWTAVGL